MLFKKKTPVCLHKHKDFPWYVAISKYEHGGYTYRYKVDVVEPYVCVHCGRRQDIVLIQYSDIMSKGEADNIAEKLKEKYSDYIQDRAIVEDMVNDTILVDQQYLRFYEMVKRGKIELPELKL